MVLVTGGTGIVGAHILVDLSKKGLNLRATRRSSSDLSVIKNIFKHYDCEELFDSIEWVEADILDTEELQEAFQGVEYVYHCAALVSFQKQDAERMYNINIEGTANIVNLCLHNNIKKLGYISSTAALGRSGNEAFFTEKSEWDPDHINSYYSVTKYRSEMEVWRGAQEGLDVVMINPAIIIGPGATGKSSGSLFSTVQNGLKFYTDGTAGFVDARDVSRAIITLMDSEIRNERFLTVGENLNYLSIFTLIANALNKKPPHIKASSFLTEIAWRVLRFKNFIDGKPSAITKETARSSQATNKYDCSKIKTAINFDFTPISDAVENTAKFLNKVS